MLLASALSNTGSVMLNTGTKYLSHEFKVTSDATEQAPLEVLVTDLQRIFHNCKSEPNRLDTAQKILITLHIIASRQATSDEQAHFAKIKEIAQSTLTYLRQPDDKISRAKYFQDKLILLLWAKKLMVSCGQEAHTGLSYMESHNKFLEAFERTPSHDKKGLDAYHYRITSDTFSSFAVSILLRVNYLCAIESSTISGLLTREELLELQSYCQLEDIEVKKITDDYTFMRKRTAAGKAYDESKDDSNHLRRIGQNNKLVLKKNLTSTTARIEPSQSLSAYYPAFDNFVDFLNDYGKKTPESELAAMTDIYEKHLTQLPAVHFAYRYFYFELNEACSLFSNRIAGMGYKKAYEGYEETVLPAPDDFQSIIAVFPEPVVPVAVEEEKKEVTTEQQPVSNKKSKATKSKKQTSPQKATSHPQQIKLKNVQITTTTSSTSSSSIIAAQKTVAVNLKKDALPFKEIVYDPRVSLWFTNPEDCLALPSYVNLSDETKKVAVHKHAFPIALDQLLGTAYCVQETYQNNKQNQVDTLFSIPGEIEFVNGTKERGLFQYCISGKDKVCYHRYFKAMSTRELLNLDQYSKAFEEAEFPPLSSAASAAPAKKSPDQELVYEPHLNTYAVTDKAKSLTFRAFKIRTLT